MNRIEEINARLAEIEGLLDKATGDELASLRTEVDNLTQERATLLSEAQTRQQARSAIANGAGTVIPTPAAADPTREARAKELVKTGHMTVETRSTLVSSGKLATPTAVSGINDVVGASVSSIVDLVHTEDCTGMGSNKVAYIDSDADAAAEQTEGSAATEKDATFGFVTITPKSIAVVSAISKQAKKQSPLVYENKVLTQSLVSLRKKAAAIIVDALKDSSLTASVTATINTSKKGVIDEKTLRQITLAHGGDDAVVGEGYLFLNKKDLIAFGDIRGTNEKKAVYEITPDGQNPNTGTIKDGGLIVRYCICNDLTALAGTAQSSTAAVKTMCYGNPQCFELDLFSDYEINVSSDFAINKLMDTIVGDAQLGGAVTYKNGFTFLTIAQES